jgi:hypothetical protein
LKKHDAFWKILHSGVWGLDSFIMQRCRQKCPTMCSKRSFGYENKARKSSRSIIGDLRFPLFWYIFKIWVEIWAEKNFKKKLFFLAMFKNEITTFKIFFFWNFRFFLKFFFQKNGHNFFHGPIFFMKFFFQRFSFFWHGWNHLLLSKFHWKKWHKNALGNHVPDLKYYD